MVAVRRITEFVDIDELIGELVNRERELRVQAVLVSGAQRKRLLLLAESYAAQIERLRGPDASATT
jgi:hypothetical protein